MTFDSKISNYHLPELSTLDQEDEEGESGGTQDSEETGRPTIFSVNTEEFEASLSPEQFALYQKMLRSLINEGHTKFGSKALRHAKAKEKILSQLDTAQLLGKKNSGAGFKTHPILPKGSGLRAQEISPEWQIQSDKNSAGKKDALLHKLKNAFKNSPKMSQKIKMQMKEEPKPSPKFNPRPPGM